MLKLVESSLLNSLVAGGVTKTAQGDAVVTTSVEVMDWPTKTWTSQRALPRRLTGER